MKRRSVEMGLLLLSACWLFGCGQAAGETGEAVDNSAVEQETGRESAAISSEKTDYRTDEERLAATEAILAEMSNEELDGLEWISATEYDGIRKVAELPEKDCYLYWDDDNRVSVIRFRDERFCTLETSYTFLNGAWSLGCADFDEDGEEEIAVFESGGGTGILITSIILFDKVDGEYQAYRCSYEDCLAQMVDRVIELWDPESRLLQLQIDGEVQDAVWDLNGMLTRLEADYDIPEGEEIYQRVFYDHQISAGVEDGKLQARFVGGFLVTPYAFPDYTYEAPVLEVEINYKDGTFEVGAITLDVSMREIYERFGRKQRTEDYLTSVHEADLYRMSIADFRMGEDFSDQEFYKLAELTEQDCWFCWYETESCAALRYQSQWMIFTDLEIAYWRVLPQMFWEDCDGDGAEEVLIRFSESVVAGEPDWQWLLVDEVDGKLEWSVSEEKPEALTPAEEQLARAKAYLDTVSEEELDQLELMQYPGDISETGLTLMAELPEQDCYLYYYGTENVGMLRFRGQRLLMTKALFAPRFATPQITCADYDGDGAEEVLLRAYTGTGTGVSIWQMWMADGENEELGWIEYDDYLEQVNDHLTWHWDEELRELQVSVDGVLREEVWDLDVLMESAGKDANGNMLDVSFEGVEFQFQVQFEEEDGHIRLRLDGGYQLSVGVMPWGDEGSPILLAEVYYSDGAFSLGDITITKANQIEE